MKLTSLPAAELIAAFRSTHPTPGGGSASAFAGAMGAALLAMVAAMPKNRAGSEEDVERLEAAAARCEALSEGLIDLVDRDSAAYEAVVAAYRLPKGSEEEKAERKGRIQLATKGAADAPLEAMRRAAEALETAAVVARFGNVNAASDVEVALELLTAAQRGARANVEINLSSIEETAYAARMRAEVARLAQECEAAAAAARQAAAQQG
jgi:formiminotetrahydrofolate cyclodeaminase